MGVVLAIVAITMLVSGASPLAVGLTVVTTAGVCVLGALIDEELE